MGGFDETLDVYERPEIKDMQKYLYDDLYALEDTHWWHLAKRRLVLSLIRRYAPRRHPRILDIGCGTGKNMEAWSHIGPTMGIDIEPCALSYCRKRGLTRVRQGRAEHTGLTASSVDVVTMLDVLEHTDDTLVIREIARILAKRGICVITVPAYQWLWSTWDVVLKHKRRYTKNELLAKVSARGLHPLYASYVFSFLPIPVILVRRLKSHLPAGRYGSDFQITSPFINKLFFGLCVLEQSIMNVVPLPFGTSIVFVAQKL